MDAENGGTNAGNRGGNAWNLGGNARNGVEMRGIWVEMQWMRGMGWECGESGWKCYFFAVIKKRKKKEKNEIRIIIKRKYYCYKIRKIKPRYQGLILKFNSNDPNQRYYLNGMCTSNTHSQQFQQSHNISRITFTMFKVPTLSKNKKKTILKNGKDVQCPWTDLSWMLVTWRLFIS